MKHRDIILVIIACSFSCSIIFDNIVVAQESDQTMEGFTLSNYGEDNKKEWDLFSDTLEVFDNLIEMTNVTANVFGEEEMVLTSDIGTFDRQDGKVYLKDNVVITTETGMKMMSDTLNWLQNEDLVYTDDKVNIFKDNMEVEGVGAEGHPSLKQLNLKEDVKVDIDEQENVDGTMRKITIVCDGPLDMDYLNQIAIFNNNVEAYDGESELYADKMTGYFDNETKQMKEVICEGNVKIIRGQDTAYSKKAIYNAKTQKISLIGRPKLVIYSAMDGEEQDATTGN